MISKIDLLESENTDLVSIVQKYIPEELIMNPDEFISYELLLEKFNQLQNDVEVEMIRL